MKALSMIPLNNWRCTKVLCPKVGKSRDAKFSGDLLFFLDRLKITYSRSSGPGGQNVNKGEIRCSNYEQIYDQLFMLVNTKAEVRFHIDSAEWIPARVKGRLKSMVSRLSL